MCRCGPPPSFHDDICFLLSHQLSRLSKLVLVAGRVIPNVGLHRAALRLSL